MVRRMDRPVLRVQGLTVHASAAGHPAPVGRRRPSCALRLLARPHNYLRRQKILRMGSPEFQALPAPFRLSTPRITRTSLGGDTTRVTRGNSEVQESRPPGSVMAKAEWHELLDHDRSRKGAHALCSLPRRRF